MRGVDVHAARAAEVAGEQVDAASRGSELSVRVRRLLDAEVLEDRRRSSAVGDAARDRADAARRRRRQRRAVRRRSAMAAQLARRARRARRSCASRNASVDEVLLRRARASSAARQPRVGARPHLQVEVGELARSRCGAGR